MLGSPFMGRLMSLFAERLAPDCAVAQRVLDWPGDVGPGGQSVPLRLAGALHALVLDGSDPGLCAAYPPHDVPDDGLWQAVHRALTQHEARVMAGLDHAPQTNEVRRAAALIPAIWSALGQFELPLVLSELGASGGLNLAMDRFALRVGDTVHGHADSPVQLRPDWSGTYPEPRQLRVRDRAAVDLNPLDPADPKQRLRLLAFLWPDQAERMALTRGAIALSTTRPAQGDAAGWLEKRLAQRHPGHLHVVYHSIAWQYFPPDTQAACSAALEAAGSGATPDSPLAHIAMEADGDAKGAALTARIWPDRLNHPERILLARVDYHGRWINWLENNCPH